MRRDFRLILLMVSGFLIGSCLAGTEEEVPETVHEPWFCLHHAAEAEEDPFFCQLCHGEDFEGTSLVPSCFVCHPSGPPFVLHPPSMVPSLPWRFPVNHGSEAKKDLKACRGCHGLCGSRTNRAFDVPLGDLEKGCESAEGCHSNGPYDNGHNPGTAHPSLDPEDPSKQDLFHWYGERITFLNDSEEEEEYFISHYNAGNLPDACTLCHGAGLAGGVGPACMDCHVIDPVANRIRCVSCHGQPPVGSTADLIEEVGRGQELEGNPVYQTFRQEVAKGFHLEHDTIPCRERDSTEACRSCHGTTANVDKHHLLVGSTIPEGTDAPFGKPGDPYECLTCHEVVFNPITLDFEFKVVRDCNACHEAPFPAVLPCPE